MTEITNLSAVAEYTNKCAVQAQASLSPIQNKEAHHIVEHALVKLNSSNDPLVSYAAAMLVIESISKSLSEALGDDENHENTP